MLGCLRSDYMFDYDEKSQTCCPKQVEVNTMAAGLVAVGTQKMKQLHAKILNETNMSHVIADLPDNFTARKLAQCFMSAWNLYGSDNAVIVFLVSEIEWNVFDQRLLEYEIYALAPSVKIRRVVFDTLVTSMQLKEDRKLFM